MHRAGRVLCLVVSLGLAGCTQKTRTPLERGQRTFLRLCSGCHGSGGQGIQQPGFKVPPKDLTDPALHQRLTDADIETTIRNGKGQMPAFGPLMPKEDVDALVLFVRSLRKP